ncbi:flagellar biosynthetic protein FliR [Caulobacter sp. S45]|uniref:flagellar biosynthetic protein FliR n=1 Tax=Caulobacter sp. S45 TaxID=1641861 RepID=UPI00157545AA|nr:flagellar biosynthetic protein FliR [Caulobacter sp. S45]
MEHFALAAQVFGIGLVFTRVGALVMLLPGIGEAAIPARIRLAFALVLALVMYPIVRAGLPPVPDSLAALVGQMGIELVVGLGLGALLRMFLGALAVAGEIVSLQTTLSFAQTTNPLQAQPTASVSAFLGLLGVTLVFVTDLHQLFIGAIAHSYALFPAGRTPRIGDLADLAIRTFAETFTLGLQLSAPVLVFALVFNVALGLVARIMPQFQVFFAAQPLSLLLGLSVFALSLGAMGLVWLDRFRAFVERLA